MRDELIGFFHKAINKVIVECAAITPDASKRNYYRVKTNDDNTYIVMDASEEKHSVQPFVKISNMLRAVPLSAPEVLAYDLEKQYAVVEDFGHYSFRSLIETEQGDVDQSLSNSLYERAIDVLIKLHDVEPSSCDLPRHSPSVLNHGVTLFVEEFLVNKKLLPELLGIFNDLYKQLNALPEVIVLLDYHVDNLMLLPNRENEMSVGILDFQDAMIGSPVYDVVSLLQDARIDVPQDLEKAMIARYCSKRNIDRSVFDSLYNILGAQRNMRIIGRFSVLAKNGNMRYLDYIPRVLGYLRCNLLHPSLEKILYLSLM